MLIPRNHVDRNVASQRIVLELIENRPPCHIGKPDIKGHGLRFEFSSKGQRRCAAMGYEGANAAIVSHLEEDACKRHVVLHDEHHRVTRLDEVAIVID